MNNVPPLTGALPLFLYPVNAVLIFFQQIGHSCCSKNDVVQEKKHSEGNHETKKRSTISRYSCHILVLDIQQLKILVTALLSIHLPIF